MIYNNYELRFYVNSGNGKQPALEYIERQNNKNQAKIFKFIDLLLENEGYLDEPYSKHIKGKIRELRVDFSNNKHRIFYFALINKKIILLHAFLKKTQKTPPEEIKRAENNYFDAINNLEIYE
ncbi:MAG: type II toxin-antitoxin system RelE/ParE family toxin [Patescibacteria group bacterium]|jgi:phage-related protein